MADLDTLVAALPDICRRAGNTSYRWLTLRWRQAIQEKIDGS